MILKEQQQIKLKNNLFYWFAFSDIFAVQAYLVYLYDIRNLKNKTLFILVHDLEATYVLDIDWKK